MVKNPYLEVIVGTYEELLIGYQLKKVDNNYGFFQSFTNHSHCGSIRSVASRKTYLASGGSDEMIKLFNMKTRTEIGVAFQQEGSVNCIQFFDDHHLFTGNDDGTICIWKAGRWNCLKTLKDHKSGVTSLCVHPSGKLALSVSKDRTLKTWNLVQGRVSFTTKTKGVGDLVQWTQNGKNYAIVVTNIVGIYNVETATVVHTIDYGRRINAIVFITDEIIAIGGDGGNIEFHAANKKAIHCILSTKTKRVKALDCIVSPDSKDERWLISSSSDGFIKLWKFDLLNIATDKPELLAEVGTGCRITCQTVLVAEANQVAKTQKNNSDAEENNEEVKLSEKEGEKEVEGSSKEGDEEVKVSSEEGDEEVKVSSEEGDEEVKVSSEEGDEEVKVSSEKGDEEVKVSSKEGDEECITQKTSAKKRKITKQKEIKKKITRKWTVTST